jgi:hypothetical protein
MASFIVEGAGPNGVRTWVVIEATNTGDARTKARQILEEGFSPNISVTADASGVATLTRIVPAFLQDSLQIITLLTVLLVNLVGQFNGVSPLHLPLSLLAVQARVSLAW